jgi:glycerol-3-phosphate acyltransferase PlsY
MNTQKVLFRILMTGSVMLFAVYIYLVGSITFNVIARKSLENTVTELTSHVNKLELSYLNNVNLINKDYAISKGFVDVHQNIFAARDINHVAIR